MIKTAELLPYPATSLWRLIRQCGVTYAVGKIDFTPAAGGVSEQPWDYLPLLRIKSAFGNMGFNLEVIESRPPMDKIKLGLPGRDEEISVVSELIRNMGRLEIPVWCYEWMPVFNWLRTSTEIQGRGGALTTGYDHTLMEKAPETEYGEIESEKLWDNLAYFLSAVLPVAEEYGVRLAMHPDDPPVTPVRGIHRIMGSIENFKRLIKDFPSPANGIALCQGNFTLMTEDLPGVIRQFGERIFFAHFRDVQGSAENFVETFHDEGKTDMLECLRAYQDIQFKGVLRPDHVPTMEGDDNSDPAYSSLGRLFAIGYIRGLAEGVYGNG